MKRLATLLLDLDGTLYPYHSPLTEAFEVRMTEYVAEFFGVDEHEAKRRRHYFYTTYGTTMRGLEVEHQINPDDYLRYVHGFDPRQLLGPDQRLQEVLARISVPKVVFTNAPAEHAEGVVAALGIDSQIERIFDIRALAMVPKPALAAYQLVLNELGISGQQALFIEDSLQNLPPARSLGITTVLLRERARPGDEQLVDYVVDDIYAGIELAEQLLT